MILIAIVEVCYDFGLTFIICETGQRGSDAFIQLNNEVTQTDWYSFPEEMKRTLLIIIINLQKPVNVEFFGSVSVCRDTFKKVSPINYQLEFFVVTSKNIIHI